MDANPDPAFLASLEWQLRSELRRGPLTTPPARKLGVLAVAAISALAGAACLGGAMRVQESRQAKAVIAGLELRDVAARRAAELAAAAKERAAQRHAAGLSSSVESRRVERRAVALQRAATIATLDLAEAKAAGRQARTEISAPFVGGRDFVLERILASQASAQRTLALDRADAEAVRQQAEAGQVSATEAAEAKEAAAASARLIDHLQTRALLRAKFVGGELTGPEAERQDLQILAEYHVASASHQLVAAQAKLDRASAMRQSGLISMTELEEARMLVATAQVEVELARVEVEAAKPQ